MKLIDVDKLKQGFIDMCNTVINKESISMDLVLDILDEAAEENKMDNVDIIFKMLNLEPYEEFALTLIDDVFMYRFTPGLALQFRNCNDVWQGVDDSIACYIITGRYGIIKPNYRPKNGQDLWYVDANGEIDIISYDVYGTYSCMLYKIGNCYSTADEAGKHIEKWKDFYNSKEQVEV